MSLPSPDEILHWAKATKSRPDKALLELQGLCDRAGASWSLVVLPQQMLAYPIAMEWAAQTGIGIDVGRFSSQNSFQDRSVRRMAMFVDAPRATHELLDRLGEPHETWENASKLFIHLNDRLLLEGLREIEREHPDQVRHQMTREFSVAAIKVLAIHLKKNSKKSAEMMRWATGLGAKWETPQHEQLLQNHAQENKKFDRQAFDNFIRDLHAFYLDQNAPAATATSQRPRL